MATAYSFTADPRSTGQRTKRYRDGNYYNEPEAAYPSNIMFDRRVVRGNTYAASVPAGTATAEAERLRAAQLRDQRRRQKVANRRMEMPGTPEPVRGRKNIEVQTGLYLEELTDKVPEVDEETQTEAYLDRPPSPLFMPVKAGIDRATQVMKGDLFDFDFEVEPILEVLVGKTLEQSVMEVLEEEELKAIRRHQLEFEQIRNAELAEVQRMEAEAIRREEEKTRRVEQEKRRLKMEDQLQQKLEARKFAKNYLNDLHGNVFNKLMGTGHFYDPLARQVAEQFMPWLGMSVESRLDNIAFARAMTDHLLAAALSRGESVFSTAVKDEEIRKAEEEAALKAAEEAKLEEAKAAEEAGEESDDE